VELPGFPDDWLIVAGDIGERPEHLAFALDALVPRFARVIWTAGNHDLWSPVDEAGRTRGQARYHELVAICRSRGVLTPEDEYPEWPDGSSTFVVPMFLLFDYSFRPPDIPEREALRWARAAGVRSGDELMLSPEPWPSVADWCHARCNTTEARLEALPPTARTILVNHWPLRYDLARPPRVPQFSLWSGTTRTEDWGLRFRARTVITGHLHMRTTLWRHGVRYDEVSLGYPRDWRRERGMAWYFREVLPERSPSSDRFVPPHDPFGPGSP
jgi:3',5'-cyclic AMP phosphodiesterase CpdA